MKTVILFIIAFVCAIVFQVAKADSNVITKKVLYCTEATDEDFDTPCELPPSEFPNVKGKKAIGLPCKLDSECSTNICTSGIEFGGTHMVDKFCDTKRNDSEEDE